MEQQKEDKKVQVLSKQPDQSSGFNSSRRRGWQQCPFDGGEEAMAGQPGRGRRTGQGMNIDQGRGNCGRMGRMRGRGQRGLNGGGGRAGRGLR